MFPMPDQNVAPAPAASQLVCQALASAEPAALRAVAAIWAVSLTDEEGDDQPLNDIAGSLGAKFALVHRRPAMANHKAVAAALSLLSKRRLGAADIKLISAGYFTSFIEGDHEQEPLRLLSNGVIAVVAIIEAINLGYAEWPAILSF